MAQRQTPRVEFPGKLVKYGIYAFLVFMLIAILSSTVFVTIPPGKIGVVFERFSGGINKEKAYGQGFHVIAPWNELIQYDVRTNEALEKMSVLSKNGLTIEVELSFRYMADATNRPSARS